MARTDCCEVPVVQSCYLRRSEPLGQRDDGSVDHAEGQVDVSLHQRRDAVPLRSEDRLDTKLTGGDRTPERQFGVGADAVSEQVRDLRYDECRHEERSRRASEKLDAAVMILIARGRSRVERARIDDQHLRALGPSAALDRLADELIDALGRISRTPFPYGEEPKISRAPAEMLLERLAGDLRHRDAASTGLEP